MPFSFILWNVRGLMADVKKAMVKRFWMQKRPSLLLLQETKLECMDLVTTRAIWGGRDVA